MSEGWESTSTPPAAAASPLSGHRRRGLRLRLAMIWRAMTVAPPMAAANPPAPAKSIVRFPIMLPQEPTRAEGRASPVMEPSLPFGISVHRVPQLVRNVRPITGSLKLMSYESPRGVAPPASSGPPAWADLLEALPRDGRPIRRPSGRRGPEPLRVRRAGVDAQRAGSPPGAWDLRSPWTPARA